MKIVLSAAFIFLLALPATAQVSVNNSKWKGVFLIPHAVDVILDFKKDTLYITTVASDEVGTIFFTQQNDTLMIKKISGPSPCPEQAQGKYRIEWFENGNKFRLHGISEECDGRTGVFTTNPFERINNK